MHLYIQKQYKLTWYKYVIDTIFFTKMLTYYKMSMPLSTNMKKKGNGGKCQGDKMKKKRNGVNIKETTSHLQVKMT